MSSHCLIQAGLKLTNFLPPPPDCWDYYRFSDHANFISLFSLETLWSRYFIPCVRVLTDVQHLRRIGEHGSVSAPGSHLHMEGLTGTTS